ncbi:hypothetical protein Tco_1477310 [Tanacetum coccineum]
MLKRVASRKTGWPTGRPGDEPPGWTFANFSWLTSDACFDLLLLGNDQDYSRTLLPAFYNPFCPRNLLGGQGHFKYK